MGIGVIAYGKLGGFELSYTSDLDIVFVHNVDSEIMTQGGQKSVSAQQFYIKLIQRVVNLAGTNSLLGDESLYQRFNDIRTGIITQTREPEKLLNDVGNMRQKMRDHLGDKDKGSLADIEFLTQYWCLLYASTQPQIVEYSDNLRQLAALKDANLIPEQDVEELINAYLHLRHYKHHEALHRAKLDKAPFYEQVKAQVQKIWARTFEKS